MKLPDMILSVCLSGIVAGFLLYFKVVELDESPRPILSILLTSLPAAIVAVWAFAVMIGWRGNFP